ncbi:DUF1127 domain-containing protein [Ewingella sp. S1.OA.A_B6]
MKNSIEERQFGSCTAAVCNESLPGDTVLSEVPVITTVKKTVWWKKSIQFMQAWNERRTTRKMLLSLTDDQLRDIGLTHSDIHQEYDRKVWPSWPK